MHNVMFNIAVAVFFIILLFWVLFVEKTFPGRGWLVFSVKDVDIKVRVLSFLLFIATIFCGFADARLLAAILVTIAFSLLVLCQ